MAHCRYKGRQAHPHHIYYSGYLYSRSLQFLEWVTSFLIRHLIQTSTITQKASHYLLVPTYLAISSSCAPISRSGDKRSLHGTRSESQNMGNFPTDNKKRRSNSPPSGPRLGMRCPLLCLYRIHHGVFTNSLDPVDAAAASSLQSESLTNEDKSKIFAPPFPSFILCSWR